MSFLKHWSKIKKAYLYIYMQIYKLEFINLFIMSKPLGKKRDRYRKMPLKTKILFLKRVLEEGHSIKKVIIKIF